MVNTCAVSKVPPGLIYFLKGKRASLCVKPLQMLRSSQNTDVCFMTPGASFRNHNTLPLIAVVNDNEYVLHIAIIWPYRAPSAIIMTNPAESSWPVCIHIQLFYIHRFQSDGLK